MPYLQLSDGRNVPVEGANFVLGADAVCDLTLHDEGVAARHAILQFDDDVWRLATLSLQSETKLNGEPVESIVALEDGDALTLGSATLRWLEKEPVSAKRFPVWVPIVLLLFICLTTLGLWAVLRQFNAPEVSPTAVVAEQTAEEAARTGDVDVTEGKVTDSATGEAETAEKEAEATPMHIYVPAPSESVQTGESEEAVTAEEAATEPVAEPEAESTCPHPEGWVQMTVEAGQRVKDIAKAAGTTARKIKDANCLPKYVIKEGDTLWVPPTAPAEAAEEVTTETAESTEAAESAETEAAAEIAETEDACPPPDGWVQVTVGEGQKVRDIAKSAATTPRKIKDANCLPNYKIEAGDVLWTPPAAATEEATAAATTEAAESAETEAAAEIAETEDACPPPDGWVQVTVGEGQKVRDIAKSAATTPRKIKDANCLPKYKIEAGDTLWVPPTASAETAEEATTETAESSAAAESAETETATETAEAEDACHIPDGWVQATVEEGMKLKDLAKIVGSKARVIKEGNCLPSYKVAPGQVIWVPPLRDPPDKDAEPTVTDDVSCPYPENWVQMTVEKGQKLRDIARKIGVQPREIKAANCLPNTKVQAGMILWVPRWGGKG